MDIQTLGSNYTYAEVQARLSALSEADIARLIQIFGVMGCESRAGLSANDVISEVVSRVLSMERQWPRDVGILPYMVQTGRSVVSDEEKKYVREVKAAPEQIEGESVGSNIANHGMRATKPSPDSQISQMQREKIITVWIEKIQTLFAGDEEATCFIAQKLAALKKAAILIACELTDQTYRNVEKRIKDKARKKFPNGLPWWEMQ